MDQIIKTSVIVVLGIFHVTKVLAYPAGAPLTQCIILVPHHGHISQQRTPAPYTVQVSNNTYSPGDVITVTLKTTTVKAFRGFMVRPILVSGNDEYFFGNWIQFPGNALAYPWYPRENGTFGMGCVTHKDGKDKTEVVFKWKSPEKSVGSFMFQASFVAGFDVFWNNVTSEVISPLVPKQIERPPYQISSTTGSFNFDSECGVTKGCILYPNGCSGTDCQFGVSYQLQQNTQFIYFEMFGNAKGYVTIGFSQDTRMGNDSTVTCVYDTAAVGIYYGFNPPRGPGIPLYNFRAKLDPTRLTDLAVSQTGDKIYCAFNRSFTDTVYSMNYKTFMFDKYNFEFWKPAYVFIASGLLYWNTGEPQSHEELPLVTTSQVDFSKTEIHHPTQIHDYLKAHSSLGVTSWLLLAPIAAFIARHFRSELNAMICTCVAKCNSMLWFHVHRSTMVLVSVINAIVIIVIFSYLKAWTKHATVHAVFGLVAIGLSYVNVILAVIRPDPDSPNRPIFNWMHRVTGILTFIVAVICLFLGSNVHLLGPGLRKNLTLIIALWVVAVTLWAVIMELVNCAKVRKEGQGYDVKEDKQKSFPVKSLLFVLYLLMCVAFYVGLIYVIARA